MLLLHGRAKIEGHSPGLPVQLPGSVVGLALASGRIYQYGRAARTQNQGRGIQPVRSGDGAGV